jgi:hypothetical protein
MEEDTTTAAEELAELKDKVAQLGDAIEELGLGGPGDGHVCEIAAKQLREFKEVAAAVGEKLMAAGLVTDAVDGLAALDFVIVRHKELEAERDTLKNLVDEYDAKAAAAALAAQKKAKAVPVKRSEKARAIGPIKLKKDEKGPDAEEIIELISAAEEVVIAFSDGKNEITALPPQVIHGDAWYQQGNAVKLRLDSLKVYGPNRDEKPITLDGYGLILDGELVAYSSRIDKLVLAPGSINELKDDIVFYG